MKISMEVKQLSPEFFFVTVKIEEQGKIPYTRDFIVTPQQLAFLNTLVEAASIGAARPATL